MYMKQHIQQLMDSAISHLQQQGALPNDTLPIFRIDHTKDKSHGDFAVNAALLFAKLAKQSPRDIATLLQQSLPVSDQIAKVEIAGPGFINFYLTETAQHAIIPEILQSGADYGCSEYGNNQCINLEFVSANPTGPLHVGHGRAAAYGDVCANLLDAVGYKVHREYYVNDAGRQMDILATSIWLRYLELCGETFSFPSNGYKGAYILDIAQKIKQEHTDTLHWPIGTVFKNIPDDEPQGGDKEKHIDALIARCQELLGTSNYKYIHQSGLHIILNDIRDDLAEFGIEFDEWFAESQLFANGVVQRCLQQLQAKNLTYEKDGNLWFKATELGDEKDRVLVRKNGIPTYFCADIANHTGKIERQADHMIDIFGSDHHGYVARVKAALTGLDITDDKFSVLLVQFVVLYRDKIKQSMSTRSGEFITLRALREEVGNDAARLFYIMRKADQHLEFDLELAKRKSNENPVYYLQYAHARICSVMRQAAEKNMPYNQQLGIEHLDLLLEPTEKECVNLLARYPELLHAAAIGHEPHLLVNYLRDLANSFHSYYNAHQFLVEHEPTRQARLTLVSAIQQVMLNGFNLLGINAPEVM